MNKKQLSLLVLVFLIILAVIFVGQKLFKHQQKIISPSGTQQNFLQQNSLPSDPNSEEMTGVPPPPPVDLETQ